MSNDTESGGEREVMGNLDIGSFKEKMKLRVLVK